MTTTTVRQKPPSSREVAIARTTGQFLSRYVQAGAPLRLQVADVDISEPIELPETAAALLMSILEAMAAGQGVTIIPQNAELTTVQAADVLNVSRPFLIKLLDEEKLPHRKIGRHRRILLEDVMNYKAHIDRERERVLDQLVADAQAHDMGYTKT